MMKVFFEDIKGQRKVAVNNIIEIDSGEERFGGPRQPKTKVWVLHYADGKTREALPKDQYRLYKVEV